MNEVDANVTVTKIFKDFEMKFIENRDTLAVNTTSLSTGKLVASVNFFHNGKYVIPAYVNVNPEYRRLGLASEMYSFVHQIGRKIKPSDLQSEDGKNMWKGFRAKGLEFAKETKMETFVRKFKELLDFI